MAQPSKLLRLMDLQLKSLLNKLDDIYVGDSTVTSSTGFLMHKNETSVITLADHNELWATHVTGSTTVYVLASIL